MTDRCPYCESAAHVEEREGHGETFDGPVPTNRWCSKCDRPFNRVPPEKPAQESTWQT